MTEIGEAVAVVLPSVAAAAGGEDHDCAKVEIVSIKDAKDKSLEGGKAEYDPRLYAVVDDKSTTITYKIENQGARVLVWIYPDSGNDVAMDYYPTPVVFQAYEVVDEGKHEVKWDGRSRTKGKRYIIHGDYKVQITAFCQECGKKAKAETKLKVKPPYAYTYGAFLHWYWKDRGYRKWCRVCKAVRANKDITKGMCDICGEPVKWHYKYQKKWESNAGGAEHWESRLKEEHDGGVGFEVTKSTDHSASQALEEMKTKSAVWIFDGHANQEWLDFMDNKYHETGIISRPAAGKGVRYWCGCHQREEVGNAVTKYTLKPEGKVMEEADLEPLSDLPRRALDDVFLLILMGCNTAGGGEDIVPVHSVLRQKGADLVLGFKPKIYGGTLYKRWLDGFMDALQDGKGVRKAANLALKSIPRNHEGYSKEQRQDRKKAEKKFIKLYSMFRVYAGKGTTPNAPLYPMRYGRKKR